MCSMINFIFYKPSKAENSWCVKWLEGGNRKDPNDNEMGSGRYTKCYYFNHYEVKWHPSRWKSDRDDDLFQYFNNWIRCGTAAKQEPTNWRSNSSDEGSAGWNTNANSWQEVIQCQLTQSEIFLNQKYQSVFFNTWREMINTEKANDKAQPCFSYISQRKTNLLLLLFSVFPFITALVLTWSQTQYLLNFSINNTPDSWSLYQGHFPVLLIIKTVPYMDND